MNVKEYNGWTNYETWLVNLWMDNEEGSQAAWREIAEEVVGDSDDDRDKAVADLADRIKNEHEGFQEEQITVTGLFADLLNAALAEVNWREIAENLVDDVKESAA